MAYFKARVGGSSGNEPVLLWTNPSSTSAFSSQTVNIDLSNYNYIAIKFATVTNKTAEYYYENVTSDIDATTGTKFNLITTPYPGVTDFNYLYFYYRGCQISATGIYFTNGFSMHSSLGTDNSLAIPLEIYGYKEPLF